MATASTTVYAPNGAKLPISPSARKSGEILPLTSLRFFAAFHVLLFHTWGIYMPTRQSYWNNFLSLGYVGVSIFFILSGYILTAVYLRGNREISYRKFYVARFARIYPLYAMSLLIVAPFTWASIENRSLHYHLLRFASDYVGSLGMIQAWLPGLGTSNVPSWSVSAEAFFYLVFPAIGLAIATKIYKPLRLAFILWLISIAISLTLCKTIHSPYIWRDNFSFARFNPLLRLPEFLIGVCAALWRPRTIPKCLSWMSVLIYLGLIPLIVHIPELVISNGLLAPVFVALIMGLETLNGKFERFLSSPVLVTLGHASYSLYLLHFPVLFLLTSLLGTAGTRAMGSPWILPFNAPERFATYLVATVVASVVSYKLIETPARRYFISRFN
jgi:peptidoglycan/LPS O-acetylase OafA/YrhL